MSFEDRTIECIDCSAQFIWTAGEQRFFHEKGFANEPRRCQDCRARKKAARPEGDAPGGGGGAGAGAGYSGGGARGGYAGGGGGYGDGARRSGGAPMDRRPRELNDFSCVVCGTSAKLPFAGGGDDPVYCVDCYSGRAVMPKRPKHKKAEGSDDDEANDLENTDLEANADATPSATEDTANLPVERAPAAEEAAAVEEPASGS